MTADDRQLLAREYELLQRSFEDLGSRAMVAKPWSVTFSAGGLALAYTEGMPILLFLATVSAAVFWIIEAMLKMHQKAHLPRMCAIEAYFRSEGAELDLFQIGYSWDKSFGEKGQMSRFVHQAILPHVFLPHLLIVLLGVGLLVFHPPGATSSLVKSPTASSKD